MIVYKGILKGMNYLDLVIVPCITETVSTKNFEILNETFISEKEYKIQCPKYNKGSQVFSIRLQ